MQNFPPDAMSLHTLTYTRDAATCLTLTGRTGEVFRGVADGRDGVVGRNDGEAKITPLFCKFIFTTILPRGRRKAASGRISRGKPWPSHGHFFVCM